VSLYYMRDDHSFVGLPDHVDGAMMRLRQEFSDGCTYGMCCTKLGPMRNKNEHARGDWAEFAPRARAWLVKALEPSEADVEYASWMARLIDSAPIAKGGAS